MQVKKITWLSLIWVGGLMSLSAGLSAQSEEPAAFNRDSWQEMVKDLHYEDDRVPERISEEAARQEGASAERKPLISLDWGPGLTRAMLIIMGVLVMAILIWVLVNYLNGPKNRRVPTNQQLHLALEEVEENLHQSDIDPLIERAVQEQRYDLAVRLYYLNVLKRLSRQGWIRWQKDKTNHQYLQEMRERAVFGDFRELTRIFERVWYGGFALSASDFDPIAKQFQAFLRQTKNVPVS